MLQLEIHITSEGGRLTIGDLKERVCQLLSNYSCCYEITTSNKEGMSETISVTNMIPAEMVEEEIIDVEALEIEKQLT